jgi:maltose-binding protein MalE
MDLFDMKKLTQCTLFIIPFVVNLFFSTQLWATPKIIFWNAHQHANYVVKLVEEFQKSSAIEVELYQFLSPKLRDEVLTQARTNQLPDLLYVPGDFVGLYREINLTPVPADWQNTDIEPRVRDAGKVDGNYYGVPLFQGNHLMLFYNRALVKKPIATWAELKTQMKDFPADMQYPITWNYREMYWLVPFMSAFGSWPLEGDKITLDTPQMQQALTFYKALANDNVVDTNCDHDCSVERFKAGKSVYMINGDWVIRDLEKAMGDKLGIAMLPKIGNKVMRPMFSSYVLAYPNLSKDSLKFEMLKKFTQFAQSKQAQEIIRDQGGLMPVNNQALTQDARATSENKKVVIKQMRSTKTMPTSPNMSIAWSAMSKGFNRLMDHNYTVQQSVQLMQRVADREVKRRKRVSNPSDK